MQAIILVHGAFHTGECWWLLTPALTQRGFNVHAPTLRGQVGNPRHPLLVTLKGYTDDIVRCAEQAGGRVTLLGHSLAGFAISAAAERRPELFSDLIYLTAAVPKLGRSTLRDVASADPAQVPKMQVRARAVFPRSHAANFFYNCCPADIQTRATELLSPQPVRPMLGRVRLSQARLGSVRKHYFECMQDRVATIEMQRQMQKNLTFQTIRTLDTDHSPFLSDPEALAVAIDTVTKAQD